MYEITWESIALSCGLAFQLAFISRSMVDQEAAKKNRTQHARKLVHDMDQRSKTVYPDKPRLVHKDPKLEVDCLVTGAAGLVGSRLIKMLVERGCPRVVCLDIAPKPKDWDEMITAAKNRGSTLEYAQCDISDKAKLVNCFEGVKVIYSLH